MRLAQREGFRLCQFSVQSNDVHMLVEATDRQAFSRGVQGLAIRLAGAVNRSLARRGQVWADRYHRRDLATPREVRRALVYVLQNHRKHAAGSPGLDACSSAAWFDGWRDISIRVIGGRPSPPVVAARTWLLRAGWRRHGLIGAREAPRS
jgi:putative transposase